MSSAKRVDEGDATESRSASKRRGDGVREFADWALQDRTIGSYTPENRRNALVTNVKVFVGLGVSVVAATLLLVSVSVAFDSGFPPSVAMTLSVLVLLSVVFFVGRFTLRQWLRGQRIYRDESRRRQARRQRRG